MGRTLAATLLLAFAGAGCALFGLDDAPALRIRTTQLAYRLEPGATIVVTIENTSDAVVHFSTCLAVTLEELDGKWIVGELDFPVCECLCPATLSPEARIEQTVSLDWVRQHPGALPRLDEGLRYRLRYAFYRDEDRANLLDAAARRSNAFTLVSDPP